MEILVIEDEPGIANLLFRGLSEQGHSVRCVGTLATAREALSLGSFELLIVDRMLPDGDGLDLIRELAASQSAPPVICLTARDRVNERIEGLQGGADDYLVKPFVFEELLARITAVTRRVVPVASRIEIDTLLLELDAMRVFRDGVELQLTAQEYKLLRFLAENCGRVLSRSRIRGAVWGTQRDPGTNVVEVYISYLRAKIDRGHMHPLIHTVRGIGYLFERRG